MTVVSALRELWRRRALVAAALVVAAVAGLLVTSSVTLPTTIKSRQHKIAVASASALLDTHSSQVVDLGGESSAEGSTLPGRAALLASLLATAPLKDDIAAAAGIDTRTLLTSTPGLGAEAPGAGATKAPLATGATVSAKDPRASTLSLQTDSSLPIIVVNAESRDPEVATKLANGTIDVLQKHLSELAGNQRVPSKRQITVKPLGPARIGIVTRGTGPIMGVAVALVVFLLLCATILGVTTVTREWRLAVAMEKAGVEGADAEAAPPPLVATAQEEEKPQQAAVVDLHESGFLREAPVRRR
jgi:hypothetical protein